MDEVEEVEGEGEVKTLFGPLHLHGEAWEWYRPPPPRVVATAPPLEVAHQPFDVLWPPFLTLTVK